MDIKTALLYLIPFFVLLLFLLPIFVEVRVSFSPLYNKGVVALFLFNIKIFYYVFTLQDKEIKLENDKKVEVKKIDFKSSEFVFMEEFLRQVKDKLKLKKCYVFYNVGMGDAFSSALVCGWVNLVLNQIFVLLKNKKPTASLCVFDNVLYNRTAFEIAARAKISISLFDVAYSFVYSLIITKSSKQH